MGVHLVTFSIADAGGKTKSLVFPTPDTATYAEICAFVLQVDSLIDACISGIILSASVQMSCPIDGALNDTPADDMLVTTGGRITMNVTGTPYADAFYVPTLAASLYDNNGVVENAGAMATLITALLSGTNIDISNRHEQLWASFRSGARANRK